VKQLSKGKSPGLDGIPNEGLKALPDEWIDFFLVYFFNIVFDSGQTPAQWSEVEIVTLYKKGNRDDPANYRGISLISCWQNSSHKFF